MNVQGAKVPGNREALALARTFAPSESERWQYFESQKEYWDNYSIMTTALNKGLAQGRAEGFAEGEAKANRENARRMKTKGYPLEDIAEVTGLSLEEVERL